MFSTEMPCIYRRHQLGEVLCQLRYPEIPAISERVPVEFQERLRALYPRYEFRQEALTPGSAGDPRSAGMRPVYTFTSEDGCWRLSLCSTAVCLSCRYYHDWAEFTRMLDAPLAALIGLYHPVYFGWIGLRYKNFISRRALGLTDVSFRELIAPKHLGVLADPSVAEEMLNRATSDTELKLAGGCRVKLHTGTGLLQIGKTLDREIKFIIDQDLFLPGKIPAPMVAAVMQMLHKHAWSIFRDAITDRLHEAMEPEET